MVGFLLGSLLILDWVRLSPYRRFWTWERAGRIVLILTVPGALLVAVLTDSTVAWAGYVLAVLLLFLHNAMGTSRRRM